MKVYIEHQFDFIREIIEIKVVFAVSKKKNTVKSNKHYEKSNIN
jgi:hypothetical protein